MWQTSEQKQQLVTTKTNDQGSSETFDRNWRLIECYWHESRNCTSFSITKLVQHQQIHYFVTIFNISAACFGAIVSPSSGSCWHQQFFQTNSNKTGHSKLTDVVELIVQKFTGFGQLNHHHHISVMELGHLLTRSGLTYPEVSSKVCHDSFCQLGNSVSLPWVIYYGAFYLHVVSSFSCIPVICLKLVLFLIPLQFVHLFLVNLSTQI